MKKLLGMQEPLAHQLSCLTGVILWTYFAILIWKKLRISNFRSSYRLGLIWLLATALFETFVLNRNLSWTEILDTYNLAKGELWGLALLWIGLMPSVIYLLKSKKLC